MKSRGPMGPWPLVAATLVGLAGCEASPPRAGMLLGQSAISDAELVGLVERISEPGGYFDTDNLISNETGYLKVLGALEALDLRGGAYIGVGPDQNYSYIATIHPAVAFIIDVRRDNLLQHLLLKALIERAPTRLEFLTSLHGRAMPSGSTWREWTIDQIIEHVDGSSGSLDGFLEAQQEIADAIDGYGLALSASDHETIRRFHRMFVDAGLSLRFTSLGRPPRPYYPTYRQLISETDLNGRPASYLADEDRYRVVRELHLANRIVPVVGDLSGRKALAEIAEVMREMGVDLSALYVSNVEYYLWNAGTFEQWRRNAAELPSSRDAVVIRSYFPNFGRSHPSAVPGYYSTQTLQPIDSLLTGAFASYWDVVTRGALELR